MEFSCRILRAEDSHNYREVRLESLKLEPKWFGSCYERELKMPKLYFQQVIENNNPNAIMLGAFYDDILVGLCGLISSAQGSVEIIQMYVVKNYRGNGVALKLLSLAKQSLERLNSKSLVLSVFSDNQKALKTYEKAGFTVSYRKNNLVYMIFTQ
ncbi:GNAT family N-acetyltransferase [Thalassomonas viridans]|uniref:GNAT family N-acetyltransferase n=1 Tax=Thalassomonas viridans TaxID=137584 RepID=A0AAF0C779_9GAMM|nr:GNAT family N-acetyltransferase [Thalassomonas viridans]WDE03418.1 GNAT family N-acetyltransferase [Thalassomonas viridans]